MDSDLSKMIKQLMSDDKARENLMSVVGGLLTPAEDTPEIIEAETTEDEEEEEYLPATDSGGIDIQSVYESLGMGNDKRVRLLNALRPYMSDRRKPKIDNAITMMQMAGISEGLGITKMFRGKSV